MCGIIGKVGEMPSRQQFERARDVLKHRGPNSAGIFFDEKLQIALGHRRLSILDLSPAGHQPMFSADKRFVIVFNGEIYNYLELKKELSERYVFTTHTDTEVILAAYSVWGEECLNRFNGMFAFAIVDTVTGDMFCARDRLGVKPFYYSCTPSSFAFASEIKGLLALGVVPRVNEAVLYDYLVFGFYDHTNETFFQDIVTLPPGHCATYSKNNLTIKPWWELKHKQVVKNLTAQEAQEQLRALMADSIKLRFRSDVPVGVNISSGLDSTSLLFYAEQTTKSDLHLFSMCLADKDFDECQFIGPLLSVSQRERWHKSFLQPESIMEGARRMVRIQDEPFGGIPTIAYAELNRQAQEKGVVVLLEGQGVDELLAGYKYYLVDFLQDWLRRDLWGCVRHYVEYNRKLGISLATTLYQLWRYRTMVTATQSQDLTSQLGVDALSEEFLATHKERTSRQFERPFDSELLNAQYRDVRYMKLPRVLRFNDRVSMAFGCELRLPYLDYRIVEFCFFLSSQFKMELGRQKIVLRDAMKGFIPEPVHHKQKFTFGAVQTPWLRTYAKDAMMGIITSESFKARPYWNHEKVLKRAERFFAGEGENSFFLWQWVNIELWLREYIDNGYTYE